MEAEKNLAFKLFQEDLYLSVLMWKGYKEENNLSMSASSNESNNSYQEKKNSTGYNSTNNVETSYHCSCFWICSNTNQNYGHNL